MPQTAAPLVLTVEDRAELAGSVAAPAVHAHDHRTGACIGPPGASSGPWSRPAGPVGIPPARLVALARYADQAWATQLADLGPERRIATLVAYTHMLAASARDDVIDIFDVVFGDLPG